MRDESDCRDKKDVVETSFHVSRSTEGMRTLRFRSCRPLKSPCPSNATARAYQGRVRSSFFFGSRMDEQH